MAKALSEEELDRRASDFSLNYHNQNMKMKLEMADGCLLRDGVAEAYKAGHKDGYKARQ